MSALIKVKDYIAALQQLDPELEVVSQDSQWGYGPHNGPKVVEDIDVELGAYPFGPSEIRKIVKAVRA